MFPISFCYFFDFVLVLLFSFVFSFCVLFSNSSIFLLCFLMLCIYKCKYHSCTNCNKDEIPNNGCCTASTTCFSLLSSFHSLHRIYLYYRIVLLIALLFVRCNFSVYPTNVLSPITINGTPPTLSSRKLATFFHQLRIICIVPNFVGL